MRTSFLAHSTPLANGVSFGKLRAGAEGALLRVYGKSRVLSDATWRFHTSLQHFIVPVAHLLRISIAAQLPPVSAAARARLRRWWRGHGRSGTGMRREACCSSQRARAIDWRLGRCRLRHDVIGKEASIKINQVKLSFTAPPHPNSVAIATNKGSITRLPSRPVAPPPHSVLPENATQGFSLQTLLGLHEGTNGPSP